jgi:hypothetical protein
MAGESKAAPVLYWEQMVTSPVPETDRSGEALLAEGWREGSLTGGDQLARVLSMYRELGFEVCLRRVRMEAAGGCDTCWGPGEPAYRVYTRRPKT